MAQEGQTATNPQTGQRVIFQGGQWAPLGGGTAQPQPQAQPRGGVLTVPVPPQSQRESQSGIENTNSQITSRGVQDVYTGVQTQGAVLNNQQTEAEIAAAAEARARREGTSQREMAAVDAALAAIAGARENNNAFSTGTIGGLIGRPANGEENGGEGFADTPLVGPAIYGGTDKAALDTYLQTIQSGLTYDFLQDMRERAAAIGGSSAGVANTNMAEFLSLGTTRANVFGGQRAGADQLSSQLDIAEEALLRKRAALMVPIEQLVAATPAQRRALLEQAYQQATRDYRGDPASAATPATGNGGGASPPAAGGGNGGGGAPPSGPRRGPPVLSPVMSDPSINTGPTQIVQNPALRGLNQEVARMVREGRSASEIVDHMRSRGAPVSPDLLSTVQQNVEFYRPHIGRELPDTVPPPNVNAEGMEVALPLSTRALGYLADNPVGAWFVNAGEGLTFGSLDELASMTNGRSLEDQAAISRYLDDAYPIASTTGRLTGSAAAFLPVGRGVNAATTALRFAPRATTAAQVGVNTLLGGFEGAMDSNEDRKTGALLGAVTSLGGDILGGLWGRTLGGRIVGEPTAAERQVAEQMVNPGRVNARLAEAEASGVPLMPVDTDPGLTSLGYFARANSDEARGVLRESLGNRNDGAQRRAVLAVSENLTPETNVTQLADDMRAQINLDVAPVRERAFAQPAPVADPALMEVLQTPTGSQALAKARKIAADEGRDPDSIGLAIVDVPDAPRDVQVQGRGVLGEEVTRTETQPGRLRSRTVELQGANWETLDYLRRGLDSILDAPERRNQFTGELIYDRAGETRAIVALRDRFVTRMRELNTDYDQYLGTTAPVYAQVEALDLGARALSSDVTAAEIGTAYRQMSPEQQAHYRVGMGNELIRMLKQPGRGWGALREGRNMGLQEKLETVFGSDAVSRINSLDAFERQMQETYNTVAGGSSTQSNMVRQEAISAGNDASRGAALADGATAVASGGLSTMLASLVRAGRLGFRDANRLEQVRANEALARDLAPILTEPDPAKARDMLNAILGNVDVYNQARRTGRSVGGSYGAGAAAGVLNSPE